MTVQGADLSIFLPRPEVILSCPELDSLRTDQEHDLYTDTGHMAAFLLSYWPIIHPDGDTRVY